MSDIERALAVLVLRVGGVGGSVRISRAQLREVEGVGVSMIKNGDALYVAVERRSAARIDAKARR